MEVIGRVESGMETEINAGAVAEDVRSENAPAIPTFPPHPSRGYRGPWRSYVVAAC